MFSRVVFVLTLLAQSWAVAADLYVSKSGSDSNPGTSSAPFASIAKAANLASAGTTIHVAPGIYSESIEVTRSGTANAPIRFVSDQRWQAQVIGGTSAASTFMVRSDYIEIVNFDISSRFGYQGIELFGSYAKAIGNHVHHVRAGACANGTGGGGITSSLSPPWKNSYSASAVGIGNVISNNVVNDIGDPNLGCALIHGIYVMNYQNTVSNNIVYRTMGWGITSWHYSRKNNITNNTVFNNNVGGINTGANDNGSIDDYTTVSNNIIVYNGLPSGGWAPNNVTAPRYGIVQEGNFGSNNRFLNNIVYGNRPSDFAANVPHSGSRSIDPNQGSLFVNWKMDGSGDYHLRSGSAASDVGTLACSPTVSGCTPTVDFDNKPRPQGIAIDVGAFELATAPTPAPTATPAPTPKPTPAPTATPVPAVPMAQLSPSSLNFESQLVGTVSSTKFVTVTNVGKADLVFTANFGIAGDFKFAGVGTCDTRLTPGANCTISVIFTPSANGIRTGTITVPNNSAVSQLSIKLTGTATVITQDLTAPRATITSPTHGSTVTSRRQFVILSTATDNVGVSSVQFYVNGRLICTDTTAPYQCAWSVPRWRGKVYSLQTKAKDAAGNIGSSAIVKVTSR